MGLCGKLLRAARNCVHSVVPVGVRQRCEHAAGKDCEESPKNAKASCAGVAVEAVANHAAYSGDLIDRTSRGKCASSFLATDRRRVPRTDKRLPVSGFFPSLVHRLICSWRM